MKTPALMSSVDFSRYEIILPVENLVEPIEKFNSAREIIFTRITPKKVRETDIKKFIAERIKISDDRIIFGVKIFSDGTIKPSEVLKVLNENFGANINIADAKINRTALLSRGRNLLDT